jgi:GNAT superfamily N-acetyltransferase
MTSESRSQFVVEEWDTRHPRFPELLRFLEDVAPEQLPFVVGERYARFTCPLMVALEAGEVAGAIRFAIQPIGSEERCPPLHRDGVLLTEAKIHAFAVRSASRGRGIGRLLQERVIRRARELGCHQVASYSCYDKVANHHIKLSLGFAAQAEVHGENEQGVYFLMPLRGGVTGRTARSTRI